MLRRAVIRAKRDRPGRSRNCKARTTTIEKRPPAATPVGGLSLLAITGVTFHRMRAFAPSKPFDRRLESVSLIEPLNRSATASPLPATTRVAFWPVWTISPPIGMPDKSQNRQGVLQLNRLVTLTDVMFALVLWRIFQTIPRPDHTDWSPGYILSFFGDNALTYVLALIGIDMTPSAGTRLHLLALGCGRRPGSRIRSSSDY